LDTLWFTQFQVNLVFASLPLRNAPLSQRLDALFVSKDTNLSKINASCCLKIVIKGMLKGPALSAKSAFQSAQMANAKERVKTHAQLVKSL
jgi:hypothetical protein